MKKSNYGKKHLFFKSNNVDKEKIALFLYLPIAVIALIICAVILLRSEKNDPPLSKEETETITEETEKNTYAPDSPSSIEFLSLGNKTCSVVGIGDFTGKELKIPNKSPDGEIVVAINPSAFEGCNTLEAVSIPETVKSIGKDAFKACPSLVCIDVDMDNDYYSSVNGVLFSKSKDLLIKYPSNKSSEKYYLNPNVKSIEPYAFEDIKNLSELLYTKSRENFESITISEGNEALNSISVNYNYKSSNNSK